MLSAGSQMRRSLSFSAVLLLVSCNAPPKGLREWTAADHDHSENSGAQAKGQTTGERKELFPGVDQVTVATWSTKCAGCHGRIGRADGPQAPMFNPTDLSDPTWQAATTDERMLASIQNGRGKMPAFALPEQTAQSLVRLVRLFDRERGARAPQAPAATAAASAAPPNPSR